MNTPAPQKRAWFQLSLATAILIMLFVAALFLVYLRRWAWGPEAHTITLAEVERIKPLKDVMACIQSPDGTRKFPPHIEYASLYNDIFPATIDRQFPGPDEILFSFQNIDVTTSLCTRARAHNLTVIVSS